MFDALRPLESAKIKCGRKHFEALGNEVAFDDIDSFEEFIEEQVVLQLYDALLAKAEELEVPIYLHPGAPPKVISDLCYSKGFSDKVISSFARYGYGWHVEPGIHMLNMIASGTFDKYPKLQIILGHWGELLPYYIDRFDSAMLGEFLGIKHDPSYYLKNNMYITPSGIYTPECLEFCVKRIGVDRIMFSIDYPFATAQGKEAILEAPFLSEEMIKKRLLILMLKDYLSLNNTL